VVFEDGPLRLGLLQEGEVGPDSVVRRFGCDAEKELDRENERQQPGAIGSPHFAERFNAQACGVQVASKAPTQPQQRPRMPVRATEVHAASLVLVRVIDEAKTASNAYCL
jgi:hypothetical protein